MTSPVPKDKLFTPLCLTKGLFVRHNGVCSETMSYKLASKLSAS